MDVFALFQQMLILLVILFIGFIAAKCKVLDEKSSAMLSALVCSVTNPLQVLSSSLSEYHPLENGEVLLLTVVSVLIFAFLIAFSALIPRILGIKNPSKARVYRYMMIFSNVGYMGYPVIEALFGKEYSFYVTIFVLVFQLICWSYGVSLMSGQKLKIDRKVLLRPLIVSALLAYALYFIDVRPLWTAAPKVMGVIYGATNTLGSMTSALAMLIIGTSLASLTVRETFGQWRIYGMCAIKLLVLPVLGWLILKNYLTQESMLGFCVVILAMPVAAGAVITSYQYGGDKKLAASGVLVSTLISMVTVPTLMMLLFR